MQGDQSHDGGPEAGLQRKLQDQPLLFSNLHCHIHEIGTGEQANLKVMFISAVVTMYSFRLGNEELEALSVLFFKEQHSHLWASCVQCAVSKMVHPQQNSVDSFLPQSLC